MLNGLYSAFTFTHRIPDVSERNTN